MDNEDYEPIVPKRRGRPPKAPETTDAAEVRETADMGEHSCDEDCPCQRENKEKKTKRRAPHGVRWFTGEHLTGRELR